MEPPATLFGVSTTGPGFMKAEEIAEFLRYDTATIYAMTESGELETHRRKGAKSHMRFTRRGLIAFMASGASNPGSREEMLEALVYLIRTLSPARRKTLIEKLLKEGSR